MAKDNNKLESNKGLFLDPEWIAKKDYSPYFYKETPLSFVERVVEVSGKPVLYYELVETIYAKRVQKNKVIRAISLIDLIILPLDVGIDMTDEIHSHIDLMLKCENREDIQKEMQSLATSYVEAYKEKLTTKPPRILNGMRIPRPWIMDEVEPDEDDDVEDRDANEAFF